MMTPGLPGLMNEPALGPTTASAAAPFITSELLTTAKLVFFSGPES